MIRHHAIAAAILAMLPAQAALAAGTLAITNVVKVPATSSTPASLSITGTCVQGNDPVKVKIQNTITGAVYTLFTSAKCGANAAAGKTINVPVPTTIPPGTYKVGLKQTTSTVIWSGTVTLP